MKTYQQMILGIVLSFLLTTNLVAQLPSIDSLRIIPQTPTVTETIKVISYTTFPSGACNLTDSSISIVETTISIIASHWPGHNSTICHSVDTLIIGMLASGIYELIYHIKYNNSPDFRDSDTIVIDVQNPIGVESNGYPQQGINVFPNPTNDKLNIELLDNVSISFIEIINMQGRLIKTLFVLNNLRKFDVSYLPAGIYVLRIYTENGIAIKKLIKQ